MIDIASLSGRHDLRLNIGAGSRKKEGFLNIDILPLPGVDIVCDLEKTLPFADDSVLEIEGEHVLEHIENFIPLMREMYRVCGNGAILRFRIPYLTSESAFKDPTHRRFFCERTFSYFSRKEQDREGLPEYNLEVDFDVLGFQYLYHKRWFALPVVRSVLKRHCWNIVKTMNVALKVVKPARIRSR